VTNVKLEKLIVKNFLSIGKKGVEIKIEPEKIYVYRGHIGSGKSTILDAIHVLLFGKTYSKKSIKNIPNRKNKKNVMLKLFFSVNDDKYELCRKFKPDKEYIKKNGEELAFTGKNGLNEIIENLFNIDKKVLNHINFLSERFYTPFMELKSTERKDFIMRLFELERYDKMKDMTKAELNILTMKLSSLEGKYESIRTQEQSNRAIIEEQENEKKEEIKNLSTKINDLVNEKKEIEKTLKNINEIEYNKLQKIYKEFKEDLIKVETQISTIENTIRRNKDNKQQTEKLRKEIENLQLNVGKKVKYEELSELSEKIQNVFIQLMQLKGNYKNIKSGEEKIKADNQKYLEKKKIIEGLKNELDKLNQIKYPDIETQILNTEDKIEKIDINITSGKIHAAKINIEDYEKQIEYYKTNDICNECKSILTDEFKNDRILELFEEINILQSKKKKILFALKQLQQTKQIEIDKLKELKELTNKIDKLKEKIKSEETFLSEIDFNDVDFSERYKEIELNIAEFSRKEDNLKKEKKEKEEQYNLQNEIASKISQFQAMKEVEVDLELYADLKTKRNELKEKIDIDSKTIEEINEKILYNNNKNEEIRKIVSEIETEKNILKRIKERKINRKALELNLEYQKETKEKIKQIEKQKKLVEKMIYVVSDKGIKKYIIKKYLDILNLFSKKYLEKLRSPFSLIFSDSKGLDANVIQRGNDIDYWDLSNGESKQINLANIFTFIELYKKKNGIIFPLIFLDEVFDSNLDPEALKDVMTSLKENIPYVNIISHREPIIEIADTLIEVEKKLGFSNYTITEVN